MSLVNTKDKSVTHETDTAASLAHDNARRSKSSGSHWIDNGVDVYSDHLIIDCKWTGKSSISVKKSDWNKLKKATQGGRIPAIVLRMENVHDKRDTLDLIVIDFNDYIEMDERIRNLEDLAIER